METWFNGKKQKEAWIQGKKCKEIWIGGKKIFEAPLPIPTDYYLALDLTSNINDKSSNAHAMSGSSYSFKNIGGKNCIEFTQGIKTTNNVTLGNIITICAEVYCTTTNLQQIISELSSDINSNTNCFNAALNGANTDRTIYGSDKISTFNQKYTNAGVFSLNQWFKVVIVFDRTKTTAVGQRTIYINNVSQSFASSTANNVLSDDWGNYPLYIGARNLTNNVLKGYMRNFRLYKRLLTAEERLALYQE